MDGTKALDGTGGERRFLSREEAARFLGLGVQTLANLAWKNEGPPAIRLSRRCVRYDIYELVSWMKAKEVRPDGPPRLGE
jgi:predicted DNA-binding transcriptional regulator AlpA